MTRGAMRTVAPDSRLIAQNVQSSRISISGPFRDFAQTAMRW
jgi:hypothetical protein